MREKAEREKRVRLTRWLRRDRRQDRDAIEKWVRTTPREDAARLVREVLRRQETNRRPGDILTDAYLSLLAGVALVLLLVAAVWLLDEFFGSEIPISPVLVVIVLFAPLVKRGAEEGKRAWKTRERATRLLARLGDPEAIRYIAPLWQPATTGVIYGSDHHRRSETLAELARVVTDGDIAAGDHVAPLRSLLVRFADARPYFVEETDAEMLLAVIRCLAKSGTPEDRRTLQRVAAIGPTDHERLELLIEAARLVLESSTPAVVTPTVPATVAATDMTAHESVLVSQRRV